MGKEKQIKDLQDYNDGYQRKIQFNNIKLLILNNEGEQVIEDYIKKYFNRYKDEEEVSLLNTFFNKYKTDTKWT